MASKPATNGTSVVADEEILGKEPQNNAINSIENDSVKMSSAEAKQSQQYLTGAKLIFVLVSVVLVYFLVMLDMAIVSVSIPAITSEFNSLLDIGWYGGAYILANSAFQPLSGKIYTYFSIKWAFLAFFLIFELGSALCGAAQSSVMLIVGRAVAGLGSSGLMNGALTILSAILPPHKQPMVMGINAGLGQIGIACGPLIGGAFTQFVSWRWSFYLNLPIGAVVAILLILVSIPETHTKPPFFSVLSTAIHSLDLVGFCLIAPAAVMFFLALQYGGNQYAWSSSVVIGLFVGALVTFIIFLVWERKRGDDAMVPFSMIKKKIVWSASGTMFFFMGVLFCADYYLPVYLQAVKNDSALMSGVHVLPTIIPQVFFTLMSGVMVQTFGYYLPWVLGGSVITTIAYGLLSLLTPTISTSHRIGFQVLYGIGCGSAAIGPYLAIQSLVPAPQIPTAMAIMIFCQNLGGSVFLLTAQTIFGNTLRTQLQAHVPNVNTEMITTAGVRSIRQIVTGKDLIGVLEAYSVAVDRVMYLGIALGIVSFGFAWGLGWKDVRVKKEIVHRDEQNREAKE